MVYNSVISWIMTCDSSEGSLTFPPRSSIVHDFPFTFTWSNPTGMLQGPPSAGPRTTTLKVAPMCWPGTWIISNAIKFSFSRIYCSFWCKVLSFKINVLAAWSIRSEGVDNLINSSWFSFSLKPRASERIFCVTSAEWRGTRFCSLISGRKVNRKSKRPDRR